MRNLRELDRYRERSGIFQEFSGTPGDETCGAFLVISPIDGAVMPVIAASELGWDHVSVSRKTRPPNWLEMAHVFRLFFRDDETAMQLHVPETEHINMHPYCLHLWRPNDGTPIPKPPPEMVGIGRTPVRNRAEAVARMKGVKA